MTNRPSLSGNQKRKMKSASRLYAVQALFQMEHSNQTSDAVCEEFLDHRFGADYDGAQFAEGDVDLFRQTIANAVENQAQIDQQSHGSRCQRTVIKAIIVNVKSIYIKANSQR